MTALGIMMTTANEFTDWLVSGQDHSKFVYARAISLSALAEKDPELRLIRKLAMRAAVSGKVLLCQKPIGERGCDPRVFEYIAVKMAVPKELRPDAMMAAYA